MPESDPNKKMEDLLRAYAKKRPEEAGPPVELSPLARRQLHDAVKRAMPQNATQQRRPWGITPAWWLRIALGGTVAVAAILVVHSKSPSPDTETYLALNDQKAPSQAAASAPASPPPSSSVAQAIPPAAPPMPAVPAASPQPTAPITTDAPLAYDATTATPPTLSVRRANEDLAKAAPPSDSLLDDNLKAERKRELQPADRTAPGGIGGGGGGFAGASRMTPPSGASGELAAKTPALDSTAAFKSDQSQSADKADAFTPGTQFVRADIAASKSALADKDTLTRSPGAPSAVMAAFKLQRSAGKIRIIDSDGSVYEGQVMDQALAAASGVVQNRAYAGNAQIQGSTVANTATQAPLLQQNNLAQNNMVQQNNMPQNQSPQAAVVPGQAFDQRQKIAVAGGFTFQVRGLNRTLNRDITFTGTYAGLVTQKLDTSVNNNNTVLPQQEWHLTGTLVIATNQFPLNAIPSQP